MPTDGNDRSGGVRLFDVVFLGYDCRQVDEHVSRLHRALDITCRRLEEERAAVRRAAEGSVRPSLAELLRQRDAVLADVARLHGQLEALLSAPPPTNKDREPSTTDGRV